MLRSRHPGRRRSDRRSIRRGAWLELAVTGALSVLLSVVSVHYDAFQNLLAYLVLQQDMDLDIFVAFPIWLMLGGLFFTWRRLAELGSVLRERGHAERRARRLAMTDALTTLPNRRGFEVLLKELRAENPAGAEDGLLIAVDLDRFKPINDLYGHAVGDAVLVETAQRLKDFTGEEGIAGRMGGDEFALYVPLDAPDADPETVMDDLRDALNRAMVIDGFVCWVGATLGAARLGADGEFFDTLVRRADLALYDAKRRQRGSYAFFSQEMEDVSAARTALEQELREALENSEIEPHYLATADLRTGATVGYELLARWNHPERGIVSPAEFIPLAEDAGLITEVMSSLLRQACAEVRDWDGAPKLAFNLSAVQFPDRWLARRILTILSETAFPPERLEIELTEDALLKDFPAAREMLGSLRAKGVSVVLDDFGTGYGSLKYVRELPIDRVKIDRSFIKTYKESANSRSIVSAIFVLARGMNMSVTAEGIEDADSEALLRELGCDFAQGFYYGRPDRQPSGRQLQFDMGGEPGLRKGA